MKVLFISTLNKHLKKNPKHLRMNLVKLTIFFSALIFSPFSLALILVFNNDIIDTFSNSCEMHFTADRQENNIAAVF